MKMSLKIEEKILIEGFSQFAETQDSDANNKINGFYLNAQFQPAPIAHFQIELFTEGFKLVMVEVYNSDKWAK